VLPAAHRVATHRTRLRAGYGRGSCAACAALPCPCGPWLKPRRPGRRRRAARRASACMAQLLQLQLIILSNMLYNI
jgi:hypothetical protein